MIICILMGLSVIAGIGAIIKVGGGDGAVCGIVLFVCGAFVTAWIFMASAWAFDSPLVTTQRLHALETGTTIEGHFFLGSGYIKNKAVYYYYKEVNGGLYLEHIDAEGTRVVQDARPGTARIVYYGEQVNNRWLIPWTINNAYGSPTAVVHVPPNSVTTSMRLSLP